MLPLFVISYIKKSNSKSVEVANEPTEKSFSSFIERFGDFSCKQNHCRSITKDYISVSMSNSKSNIFVESK